MFFRSAIAESQVPVDSSDAETQAALTVLFTPTPAARESLLQMYTYKVTPTFEMVGDQLASHPPPGQVAVYIPYADAGLKLLLSQFLQDVISHCWLMLLQFPPAAMDHLTSFVLLCRECKIEPSVSMF